MQPQGQKTIREERVTHPDFLAYTEMIVAHKNYQGLYYSRKSNGQVKWVEAGKSANGQVRRAWWDDVCKKQGITIEPGCYAKAAYVTHPTKRHTCQMCGRQLRLDYVYPNARLLRKLHLVFGVSEEPFAQDIFELIDQLVVDEPSLKKMGALLKLPIRVTSKEQLKAVVTKTHIDTHAKTLFSPGAMSNSPDRFDGYHSDGACCRSKSDKGRHKTNLRRYTQDRRAYENWADGDWKKANMLMGEFNNHGVSADHIGPISLGFAHRAKFNPLTAKENSAKNNRMSVIDVKTLIEDEKLEPVVSWHSKAVWDKHKHHVVTDADAKALSSLMRKNLHTVLTILSRLHHAGHDEFLTQFLHPEYAFFTHRFVGFNPATGSYANCITTKQEGANQIKNANRHLRISFEELAAYTSVQNRNTTTGFSSEIEASIAELLAHIGKEPNERSVERLKQIFQALADATSLG